MYDGMNLYRAVVAYASATTGDIRVRIPAILGPTEVLPISKIGRAAVGGTWQVPLLGSQVVVAIEDDRFSNVYMVYPNLAVIVDTGGGGEEPPPEEVQYVPSGAIMQYAGETAPDGWVFCRGQSLSRTGTYANLFAAIGYAYGGSGDNFVLPNLQGKLPIGFDSTDTKFDSLIKSGGSQTRSLTESNLPSHAHTLSSHTHSLSSHTHTIGHGHTGSTGSDSHNHTVSVTGGGHSHPMSTGAALAIGAANSLFANSGNPPVVSAGSTGSDGGHSHTASSGNDSHNHTVTIDDATGSSGGPSTANTGGPSTANTGNGSGTATAFEILPPYIVVNYIIKV